MAPELAASTVYDLLQNLKESVARGRNLDELLHAADEVLEVLPGDEDAIRYKLVALIQHEKFDKALALVQLYPQSNKDLKALCLYRLQRYDDVLNVLRTLDNKSVFTLQIEAQTLYKKGDFDGATEVYKALLADGTDEDVKCNAIAAFSASAKSEELFQMVNPRDVAKTSYELAYNTACALINKGSLAEAEEHLLVAMKLGEEQRIENELPEEELAPLNVQLAYIHQVQGRTDEASEAYLSVLKTNLEDDMPSMAVASNNLAALRRNKDVSDSLRKFEAVLDKNEDGKRVRFPEPLKKSLSSFQKEAIIFNYVQLLLAANRLNQVRDLVPLIAEEYRESSMPYLLKACLFLKEGKLAQAEDVLAEYAEKQSEASTEALLLRSQARAAAGNYAQAAETLQRIGDARHMPALVATVVDLKQRGGDLEGAEAVLDAAIDWWSNRMDDGSVQQAGFFELIAPKAAELKLLKKKFEDAASLYEKLTSSSSEAVRLEAFTGLVCSFADVDISKAESYEGHLPTLHPATSVQALERTAVVSAAAESEVAAPASEEAKMKKKRKRKPRLPKGYDPENPGPPPDPERWLPMRERSTYRPKKKDKRAASRGSQGAVPVSNGPSSSSSKPASSTAAAKQPAEVKASSSNNNQRNNRKKGRR